MYKQTDTPTYKTQNWPRYKAIKRRSALSIWFDPTYHNMGSHARRQAWPTTLVQ